LRRGSSGIGGVALGSASSASSFVAALVFGDRMVAGDPRSAAGRGLAAAWDVSTSINVSSAAELTFVEPVAPSSGSATRLAAS
jgi:hypothetical protein